MKRTYRSLASLRAAAVFTTMALILLAAAAPAAGATRARLVKDINPTGSSFPSYLTKVGSTLFFSAKDGVHGEAAVGSRLFFAANDIVHGMVLWRYTP